MDIRVESIVNALNDNEIHHNTFKRGNSWLHCHQAFRKYAGKTLDNDTYELLALHLAFYLASWGMYRGSSFLLDLDYKIHIEPVKLMMHEKYCWLFNCKNPFANNEGDRYYSLLFGPDGIYPKLEAYYLKAHQSIAQQRRKYDEERPNKKSRKAKYDPTRESDTLLTKILLGVYGCIPAYDRYFKQGISLFDKQQSLIAKKNAVCQGPKALCTLLQDCKLQKDLDAYWQKNIGKYTFMKVVDMYFFSLGALLDEAEVDLDTLKHQIAEQYGHS